MLAIGRTSYERLSDLYLTLWKQLLSGDNKWLEVRPVAPADLQEPEIALAELKLYLPGSDKLTQEIHNDFRKTQRFLAGVTEIDGATVEEFKDHLREHGLQHAQRSDEL